MATRFASARHQAALGTPTGYRRWSRFTFSRQGVVRDLEPIGGSLVQDARRAGRWSGRLQFTGESLIPYSPRDLLTPFGTRVEIEMGLELLDGSISAVPYGTYEISSAKVKGDPGERVVDVQIVDVSQRVDRYRFELPFSVGAASDLGRMINQVVTNRLGISPNVGTVGQTLGAARVFGLDPQTGPWKEVLDVLAAFGRTAWYDRSGLIQVGSVTPDPALAYPLDQLTSFSADFDTQPANVVVARGEGPAAPVPVIGVALDLDPGSPTFAGATPGGSAYGRVTEYVDSELITTVPQATAAAQAQLNRNLGGAATFELARPFDPTIDAMDVISSRGSVAVVDSVTLDLAGDTTLQVREIA